jgi:TolA-binding protein
MKSNLAAILLVLACAGLAIVSWLQYQTHASQTHHLDTTINNYSNRVATLEETLDQDKSVRSILESNLVAIQLKASNDLAVAQTKIASTAESLDKAQAEAKAAAAAVAAAAQAIDEKNKKIAELEGQNTELDKQSSDLHSAITNLEAQIRDTQKKLDASDGTNKLLSEQLERLRAQKEELERKLSDLASLKEQVRLLKENLSIARRLDYIRQGIFDFVNQKGSGRMMNPLPPGPPAVTNTNKSLDVEIHQSGGVRIISPATTNAPAAGAPSSSAPAARLPSTNAPPAR